MADELLPVGQKTNYKRFVETATSSVVAELVATWARASTEVVGHIVLDASTVKIGALQPSTEVIGHIIADASTVKIGALQPSTEVIGHVLADASTAKIGALQPSTEVIGHIIIDASTVKIGALQPSTEMIGHTIVDASTAKIGALQPSTEVIGHILADASTAKFGALQPSTEVIGHIIVDASTAKIGALQPSTETIGQVGGNTALVSVNLAPTTSAAYSAGDLIGGQLSITNVFRSTSVMSGVVNSLVLVDKSTMQASFDLVLFHTDTTGTTYTNDAALDIDDGDLSKIAGIVSVSNLEYIAFADNTAICKHNIGLPVKATTGTALYAAVINRSAAPQYTSTGDLTLTLGIFQD